MRKPAFLVSSIFSFSVFLLSGLLGVFQPAAVQAQLEYKNGIIWDRPERVEDAQPVCTPAPEGAIVLFDGTDMKKCFHGVDKWVVKDGYAEVHGGTATTRQSFGSCHIHLEWASPKEVRSSGQGRGNSGVYIMGKYEVQILDSYQNDTYFDGQCASIYKQNPPLKNACRKPGEWQSYDITFTAPKFDEKGNVTRKARITVVHNGVVVQDDFELWGGTFWYRPAVYQPHAAKLPLMLQDHGNPVRFRNIWVKEIED